MYHKQEKEFSTFHLCSEQATIKHVSTDVQMKSDRIHGPMNILNNYNEYGIGFFLVLLVVFVFIFTR